ncbi:fungal specific transcription factor domain-containing protein [Microdochium nivale]|nr:fungal specific transcription factor domain-containing protein [Microdochium nivale]
MMLIPGDTAMTSTIKMRMPLDEARPLPSVKRHCWECLRRRLVCDSGRPYCRKCYNAGIVCPGYDDKKPLKWIANGSVSSRPRQQRSAPAAPGKAWQTKAQQSKMQQLGKEGSSSSAMAIVDTRISPPGHSGCLRLLPHVDLRSAACDVVQAAYYYNTWVLPSYDAALELAPNPFIGPFPMDVLPHLTGGLRHTVVALALGHRIHQLPTDAGRAVSVDLWSRLFHHRLLAVRELSRDIASEDTRASDGTIVTIILFLFVELQQMPASNWRQHLDGLTQLIDMRGGPRYFLETLPSLAIGLSSFYMVGIMANTTCPPLWDDSAASHYELLDLLTAMYAEGGYPTCLCPPALFVALVEINFLRARRARANLAAATAATAAGPAQRRSASTCPPFSRQRSLPPTAGPGLELLVDPSSTTEVVYDTDGVIATSISPTTDVYPTQSSQGWPGTATATTTLVSTLPSSHDIDAHATRLIKNILAFSPDEFATTTTSDPSHASDRLVLGRLWQSALVIYLIASLQSVGALCSGSGGGPELAHLRGVHGRRLHEQLRIAVDSGRLKKSVLWPLVVCGFDAADAVSSGNAAVGPFSTDSRGGGGEGGGGRGATGAESAPPNTAALERRRFVEARLPIMGRDVGTSLPDYAMVVLRRFWDSGRSDWDGCFDRTCAFVT